MPDLEFRCDLLPALRWLTTANLPSLVVVVVAVVVVVDDVVVQLWRFIRMLLDDKVGMSYVHYRNDTTVTLIWHKNDMIMTQLRQYFEKKTDTEMTLKWQVNNTHKKMFWQKMTPKWHVYDTTKKILTNNDTKMTWLRHNYDNIST